MNKVTRFAPTPSGFLHIGNYLNLFITKCMINQNDKLYLRIDDSDRHRCKPIFIKGILDALELLDLKIDLGPSDANLSHYLHRPGVRFLRYQKTLDTFSDKFVCECSRKEQNESNQSCPRNCLNRNLKFVPGHSQIRWVNSEFNYPTLWNKDNFPSYHLTSVIDDNEMEINLIIRGEDLLESTKLQIALESALGLKALKNSRIYHHPIILNRNGQKISKSKLNTDFQNSLYSVPTLSNHLSKMFFNNELMTNEISSFIDLVNLVSPTVRTKIEKFRFQNANPN